MALNEALLLQAASNIRSLDKRAFVASGDPAMGAGPPAGDPMAGGGAPPPGGDPMAGGGAPPPGGDPMAAGGGGGDIMAMIQPMIQQAVQQAMAGSGGGGGAGGGGATAGAGPGLKPKIDINVEIMQMKKLIARLCDAMGVQIPAAEMVATSTDLNQMAAQQNGGAAAGGQQGGGAIGQVQPMQPMKSALDEWESGEAFTVPAAASLHSAHEQTRTNGQNAVAMLARNQQRRHG